MTSQLIEKEELAKINDQNRSVFKRSANFKVSFTPTVFDSPDISRIIEAVMNFDEFNEDNDPHGEHDFGAFEINGVKYFWKIGYYDANYEFGADPYTEYFKSLLTIMRADEY